MNILEIENKSAKLKLNDIVMQPVMDDLIRQIGKVFGASAAEKGEYTGELTNFLENAADTLDIEIHSPGGSVLDGYMLYNELLKLRSRGVFVTAHINSLAASMASVIAMAADKITMVKEGRMMIHDVQQGIRGNAEDLAKAATLCDQMSDEIAGVYANRTGNDKDAVRKMMKSETWFNSADAKKNNFIDEIIDLAPKREPKNSIDIAGAETTHASMSFLERLTSPASAEAVARISELENDISIHDRTIADLTSKLETAEGALQEAAGLSAKLDALTAQVATIPTLENVITEHVATIAKLTAENVVTSEKIATAAAEKLAAMGHGKPIDLGKESRTENVMTRAAFSELNPAAKSAHLRSGGKLTD